MHIRIFESDFNGYIYKAGVNVDAIGITLDGESFGELEQHEMSIKCFTEVLEKIFNIFPGKNLYLIDKKQKTAILIELNCIKVFGKIQILKGNRSKKYLQEKIYLSCLVAQKSCLMR